MIWINNQWPSKPLIWQRLVKGQVIRRVPRIQLPPRSAMGVPTSVLTAVVDCNFIVRDALWKSDDEGRSMCPFSLTTTRSGPHRRTNATNREGSRVVVVE